MRTKVLIASILFFLPAVLHAQVEAYVTYSPTHLSNVESGVNSSNQTQYSDYWASGIGGGVTLNFLPLPAVSLGLDLRGSTKSGTNGADTALAGLKLGVHVPGLHLKPYIEGAGGYLATRTYTPAGTTDNNKFLAWEILGGIDDPIAHFLDWRVIELGGGQGIKTGSGPNASLFTVNTGLVVHF